MGTTTTIGLLLALLGPPVVALVGPKLEESFGSVLGPLIGLGGIVVIVSCVLVIVLRSEHQPLASLGFQTLRWRSLVLGLALALFFIYAFAPAIVWLLARLPFGGFEAGLARASTVPTWLLVITILVVATAEEILYRGYAVERLAGITGSYWIAGTISVLVFAAAHVPNWGLGAALSTLVSGAILTAFFVWQRDLSANIIAHVVTDLVGIVVLPMLTRSRLT